MTDESVHPYDELTTLITADTWYGNEAAYCPSLALRDLHTSVRRHLYWFELPTLLTRVQPQSIRQYLK